MTERLERKPAQAETAQFITTRRHRRGRRLGACQPTHQLGIDDQLTGRRQLEDSALAPFQSSPVARGTKITEKLAYFQGRIKALTRENI
jgi:hypothetical protein